MSKPNRTKKKEEKPTVEEAPILDNEESLDSSEVAAENSSPAPPRPLNAINEKALKRFSAAQEQRGIIYLSRIPPFMKAQRLRAIFSDYGEIVRIYLTPEDFTATKRRRQLGASTRKKFTDGWVEFSDKRIAKRVALTLNNQPIGGKKRSYYHDDIWNIRYLSGFKWANLTEKVAYERAVRKEKIRLEMQQAKQETEFYQQRVQEAKKFQAMDERKKRKREEGEDPAQQPNKPIRQFTQRSLIERSTLADVIQGRS